MTPEFKIGTFVMISIKCRIFFNQRSYCLLNHGGSLLSHKTVLFGIKLIIMLKAFWVKISTFSSRY